MTHGRAATDAGGQDRPHVRRTIEDPAMRCHPAAVALLLLAGCASTPKPEPMPTLVKVPVVEYVRVPDSLTKPCPVTRVASRTVEAVVSAYNANVTALESCNARSEEHTSELQSLMRISYA